MKRKIIKLHSDKWTLGATGTLSLEDKGYLIDLCCLYLMKSEQLPIELAKSKLGGADSLERLYDKGIIQVHDQNIIIPFISDTSNKNTRKRILMKDATISDVEKGQEFVFQTAQAFYQLFGSNAQKLKVNWVHLENTNLEKCLEPIRLMIDKDKRTKEDFRLVWDFLKNDDFWIKHIRSTDNLRKHFDKLITNAKNPKNGKSGQVANTGVSEQYLAGLLADNKD